MYDNRGIDIGDVLLALAGMGMVVIFCLAAYSIADKVMENNEFHKNINSVPVLVDATVKNDTGSAIILEDKSGNRIVVGVTDGMSSKKTIGYNERVQAYVDSTGVKPGDKVVVEARGDFYSNIRVLKDEFDEKAEVDELGWSDTKDKVD